MKSAVVKFEIDGKDRRVNMSADGSVQSQNVSVVLTPTDVPNMWNWTNGSSNVPVHIVSNGMCAVTISIRGYSYTSSVFVDRHHDLLDILNASPAQKQRVTRLSAPMPGLLKSIMTKEGASVKKGETLFILEAMKMENAIKAPVAGVVRQLTAKEGIAFEKGAPLCAIEPNAE